MSFVDITILHEIHWTRVNELVIGEPSLLCIYLVYMLLLLK